MRRALLVAVALLATSVAEAGEALAGWTALSPARQDEQLRLIAETAYYAINNSPTTEQVCLYMLRDMDMRQRWGRLIAVRLVNNDNLTVAGAAILVLYELSLRIDAKDTTTQPKKEKF